MKSPLVIATLATLVTAGPAPPFPAPKLTAVTPETRCDWGPITDIKPDRTELVMRADAGPFEVKLVPGLKVAGADGKPLAGAADLRAGQRVRVYYVVDRGARAQEIDVMP
jgi:hypothetical protein